MDHHSGFAPPAEHPLGREHGTAAVAELLAIGTLVVSTVVVAAVVTTGFARADVADSVIGHEGSLFTLALLLGLLFIGIGGLSVLPHRRAKKE